MGRRAKKAPVVTKKRAVLATRFKCPFCANDKVVECKMDRQKAIGSLNCRICGASYQMAIHSLHEPIDVFSEWLDDCEAAERANTNTGGQIASSAQEESHGGAAAAGVKYDSDDDSDDLGHSSGLHSKKSSKKKSASKASKSSITDLGLDSDDDSD